MDPEHDNDSKPLPDTVCSVPAKDEDITLKGVVLRNLRARRGGLEGKRKRDGAKEGDEGDASETVGEGKWKSSKLETIEEERDDGPGAEEERSTHDDDDDDDDYEDGYAYGILNDAWWSASTYPGQTLGPNSPDIWYAPNSAGFSPKSPNIPPHWPEGWPSPGFSPMSPKHATASPAYNPMSPKHAPTSPAYSPMTPTHAPTSPGFSYFSYILPSLPPSLRKFERLASAASSS